MGNKKPIHRRPLPGPVQGLCWVHARLWQDIDIAHKPTRKSAMGLGHPHRLPDPGSGRGMQHDLRGGKGRTAQPPRPDRVGGERGSAQEQGRTLAREKQA